VGHGGEAALCCGKVTAKVWACAMLGLGVSCAPTHDVTVGMTVAVEQPPQPLLMPLHTEHTLPPYRRIVGNTMQVW
jgi:hypothetical protein